MEVIVKLEISLSPALSALLQGFTSGATKPAANGTDEAAEEKAQAAVKRSAAKEKVKEQAAAPAAKAAKITLSDIRQWAVKSAENKAALAAELANHGAAKLAELPEDKIEAVYNALTEEL